MAELSSPIRLYAMKTNTISISIGFGRQEYFSPGALTHLYPAKPILSKKKWIEHEIRVISPLREHR